MELVVRNCDQQVTKSMIDEVKGGSGVVAGHLFVHVFDYGCALGQAQKSRS
jgi:hypothetical protein